MNSSKATQQQQKQHVPVAGVILSPAIMGRSYWDLTFTSDSVEVLGTIQSFAYAFFIFLIGVKTDLSRMIKVSKTALSIGLLSVIGPLLCGVAILLNFSKSKDEEFSALYLSIQHTTTSFPVIASLLSELKILNSALGRLVLSSGLIGDFMSLVISICCSLVRVIFVKYDTALAGIIVFFAYVVVVVFVFRPLMLLVVRNTPQGKRVSQGCIYAIVLMFLLGSSLIKWCEQFGILGPYILGLAVPAGPPLGSTLVDMFDGMSHNFLTPLFVSISAMRLRSFKIKYNSNVSKMNSVIAVVSFLVKLVVCLLPPLFINMPMKDSVAVSLIMSCKGVVELAIFTYLNDAKVIDKNMFAVSFFIIITTASIVPILVKRLYDPSRKYSNYQKRNIMDSKPNAELQILTCIHVPDNVREVINLLDVSFPTKDNPLEVNVLHLIKLNGQASPIFISHNKKRRQLANCSYSENVILSFSKFEANNWGAVSVNTFTAVSPSSLMDEDICSLALDKRTSCIILPFHRRWFIDGSIESDDESIRILNSKVLEKAPCSVGILINRGNVKRPIDSLPITDQSYKVAMIFLGGSDDREALTFAKRMVQDDSVKLTVAHFIAQSNDGVEGHEKLLDSVIIRDVASNERVSYVEKVVADGPETAMIVHSMVNQFDLIIVGRRDNMDSTMTAGLIEWSVFPELGVIGDLLASIDYVGRSSVLVVQQQKTL